MSFCPNTLSSVEKMSLGDRIKLYFMQTKPNLNESVSSSSSIEFDASFEEILSARRAKFAKDNSTAKPFVGNSHDSTALQDQSKMDSFIADKSTNYQAAKEDSVLNRLLSEFGISDDTDQKNISGVATLEQSLEEGADSVYFTNPETSATHVGSFTTANERFDTIDEGKEYMSKNDVQHDEEPNAVGVPARHTQYSVDSLEGELDSRFKSRFTQDSLMLRTEIESVAEEETAASILPNVATETKYSATLDDTLEVVEYVMDDDMNYRLKPVSNPLSLAINEEEESLSTEQQNEAADESCILVESSPDSSYQTAKTTLRPPSMHIKSESLRESQVCYLSPRRNTRPFYDDKFEKSLSNLSQANQSADVIDLSVDDEVANLDRSSDMATNNISLRSTNTLDEVSSIMTDRPANDSNAEFICEDTIPSRDDFNDTLEMMDYMMERGRKLLKSTKENVSNNQSLAPLVRPKDPVTTILKQRNLNSPRSVDKMIFKKPEITPGVLRKPPAKVTSKIPKPKSATKNPFSHIVSPISMYIKNVAPSPNTQNIRPEKNFFDSSYCNKAAKELDFTLQSVSSDNTPRQTYVSALPKKAYISAENRFLKDNRTKVMPGGKKIQQIVGETPVIIRHDGQINVGSPLSIRHYASDDSIADISLMPGDVSVQVVKNVNRL